MSVQQEIDYQKQIQALTDENAYLKEQVEYLKRKLFGSSSEKIKRDDFPGQLSLFDEVETTADENAPEPTMEQVKTYARRKYNGQREALVKDLPTEKIVARLAKEDQVCSDCGSQLFPVGEEFVRREVQFIPARLKVIEYYRETYECRNCKKNGRKHFEKSPLPYPPVQHSLASPSTIAWAIHQKYELAVPMYRQELEWKSLGLEISRKTLCNWVIVTYRDWFSFVVKLLTKKLLEQNYIHADETPVQVLNEPGRKNTTMSYMWVYASIKDAEHPVRLFDVKRCFCWVHLRKCFYDALPKDLDDPKATKPGIALQYIGRLFDIEESLADLTPEERKIQRLKQEKPVLDEFFAWVDSASLGVPPKSNLGEAFGYAQNQKDGLLTYLEDGHCSISNQLAENSIRPFTIERKNWLFSGSPRGAEASAGIYTLIETAKENGLDLMKYIQFILEDMPGTAFQQYPEILEDYLPWNLMIQEHCHR